MDAMITACGLVSPVGLNLAQTYSSVRAGVVRIQEYADALTLPADDRTDEYEPLKGCRVPVIPRPVGSLPELTAAALQDLLAGGRLTRDQLRRLAFLFALAPSDRPGRTVPSEGDLRGLVQGLVGGPVGPVQGFPVGEVAAMWAVEAAGRLLERDMVDGCVVIGVDSWHSGLSLAWLDENGRLKSARNRNGFVPGEAACALLLETPVAAKRRKAAPLARVAGTSRAKETRPLSSGEPSTGQGLAGMFRELPGLTGDGASVEWVICDLNGERYRHQDWGNCLVNLSGLFRGLDHVWHPAECLGDLGSAGGAVHLALAARAFQKGQAPAAECVVWGSADSGERAGILVRAA